MFILKNKNYGTYLKIQNRIKRYPIYKNEATRFTKQEAIYYQNRFKHPENWKILEVKKEVIDVRLHK